MIINSLDNTRFEVNFIDLHDQMLRSHVIGLIEDYLMSDVNTDKTHTFDVLFLTPSNMASDQYISDLSILSKVISGAKIKSVEDGDESRYNDITSVDDQAYFNFTDI